MEFIGNILGLNKKKRPEPTRPDTKNPGRRKTYDEIVDEAVNGPSKEQKDRQSTDSNNY